MEDLKFLIQKLEKELSRIEAGTETVSVGTVLRTGDGVVWIEGLAQTKLNEILLVRPSQTSGAKEISVPVLALNLEEELIGAIALADSDLIKEGDMVIRTETVIQTPVGPSLIGRVVNPLGRPLDGLGEIKTETFYPLEREAPGVIEREPVRRPLQTGIKAIDGLIPIGRGQRELILGDRQIGKTAIALDVILNQKDEKKDRPICVYVGVGQKLSKIKRMYEILKKAGALDYTIMVVASASDPAALIYLSVYSGCSIGEYFRDNGQDAVVIYDDLTKHAWAWRELSLLLKRPVGREAYPGDIFYTHARLLERAAKLKEGGSLTALPICETQLGDISSYIPTNLISITDGQIYLETDLFNKGFRPAISIGLSVSRVGSQAQTKLMKKVAGRLKLDLAQFRELEAFAQVTSDLAEASRKKLERGRVLTEILKQENLQPLSFEKIAVLFFAANEGYLDGFSSAEIFDFENKLLADLNLDQADLAAALKTKADIDDTLVEKLNQYLKNFVQSFRQNRSN